MGSFLLVVSGFSRRFFAFMLVLAALLPAARAIDSPAAKEWYAYMQEVTKHDAGGTFKNRPKKDLDTFYLYWGQRLEKAATQAAEDEPLKQQILLELTTLQTACGQYFDALDTNQKLVDIQIAQGRANPETISNLAGIAMAGFYANKPSITLVEVQQAFQASFKTLLAQGFTLEADTLRKQFTQFFEMDEDLKITGLKVPRDKVESK